MNWTAVEQMVKVVPIAPLTALDYGSETSYIISKNSDYNAQDLVKRQQMWYKRCEECWCDSLE